MTYICLLSLSICWSRLLMVVGSPDAACWTVDSSLVRGFPLTNCRRTMTNIIDVFILSGVLLGGVQISMISFRGRYSLVYDRSHLTNWHIFGWCDVKKIYSKEFRLPLLNNIKTCWFTIPVQALRNAAYVRPKTSLGSWDTVTIWSL